MNEINKVNLTSSQQKYFQDKIEESLSKFLNEEAVEGVLIKQMGGEEYYPTIIFKIVYDNTLPISSEFARNFRRNKFTEINQQEQVYYSEEIAPISWYEDYKKYACYDYQEEKELLNAIILYDKNNRLTKVKEEIENGKIFLEQEANICEFIPPLQLKKKK